MSTAPLLSPGQVIGQHRVERLLGRGGIAEVYLVTELAFDVQQALKVMIGDDHDWGRRLIREGRAQYLVQHANLVRVFGSLTVQGRPALVMEYVEGTDLHRWLQALRQRGRWPAPSQALELFQGVLAGVGAVHARGLVHRDLKPANILVELTEGGVVPKVTDFGLVKDVVGGSPAGEVTVAGTIMGTQGYIAPEQIWALSEIDARADVFSLGCILYLLLCRKPAFGDVDTSVTFSKVLNEEYTDPREHTPDLLDSLYLAIRYSLVSERARRIPSCEALWEVIQRGRPALEELGLLHEREELPAVAPSSSSPLGDGPGSMVAVTTARRPLVEVETVAIPRELVEHLLGAEQPTQEEPKEAVAPPEPAAPTPGPVVAEAPRAAVAPAPPRTRPPPARGRRPIHWRRVAVVALVTIGLGGLAAALGGVLIVARMPESVTPGALAPALEPDLDLAPSAPEIELPSAVDRQVRSDPPSISAPPAPSPKPAPELPPVASPQGVGAPAPGASPGAGVAAAPAASPAAEAPSASGSSQPAPVAAPPVSPAPVTARPAPGPVPGPSPAPPPAVEPPTGRVIIEGTAQRVCLLGHADGQVRCAARVPTGGYDVLIYVGEEPVTAGVTEVRQDAVTSLRCDAAFLTCYSS